MADVVMNSSRHIFSTTITTFGGFLPLILSGGGFWPPFAMAIAGGVLLSTVVSFYFVPPAFKLVWARKWRGEQQAPSEAEMERVSRSANENMLGAMPETELLAAE